MDKGRNRSFNGFVQVIVILIHWVCAYSFLIRQFDLRFVVILDRYDNTKYPVSIQ